MEIYVNIHIKVSIREPIYISEILLHYLGLWGLKWVLCVNYTKEYIRCRVDFFLACSLNKLSFGGHWFFGLWLRRLRIDFLSSGCERLASFTVYDVCFIGQTGECFLDESIERLPRLLWTHITIKLHNGHD